MKLSILVHTVNFCGDHSADACVALSQQDGETVEQLVARSRIGLIGYAGKGERIEIRLVYDEA